MEETQLLLGQLMEMTDARLVRDVDICADGSLLAAVIQTTDVKHDRLRTTLEIWDLDDEARLVFAVPRGTRPQWSPHENNLAFLRPGDGGEPSQLAIWRADKRSLETILPIDGVLISLSWHPNGTDVLVQSRIDDGPRQDAAPWVVREVPFKKDGVGRLWPSRYRLTVVDMDRRTSMPLSEADQMFISPTWNPPGDAIAYAAADEKGTWVATEAYILAIRERAVYQVTKRHGTISWIDWKTHDELVIVGQDEPGPNRLAGLQSVDARTGAVKNLLQNFDRRVLASSGSGSSTPRLVGRTIVFCAREGGSVRLYTVAADGGVPVAWSSGLSVISAIAVAEDRDRFCLVMSDTATINDVFIADGPGGPLQRVSALNARLERQVTSRVTELSIDAFGSSLHGYLLHGDNLDEPTPLLVDIHGGPDTAWRPSISPHYWYREVLVRRGWKVLLLNPRGSDGYGDEYMRAAVGNLGFSEEADFMCAIENLTAAGRVDHTRLAVMGASHGGFMTNWLTSRTDLFRAAVSISCIANWLSLYGTSDSAAAFVEFQMGGTPIEHPERYRNSSPLTYVDRASTPTLILHGEDDQLNPIGQSEEWFTGLLRLADVVDVEFVRYPGAGHLLIYQSRPSVVLDTMRRMVLWLETHAGGHGSRETR